MEDNIYFQLISQQQYDNTDINYISQFQLFNRLQDCILDNNAKIQAKQTDNQLKMIKYKCKQNLNTYVDLQLYYSDSQQNLKNSQEKYEFKLPQSENSNENLLKADQIDNNDLYQLQPEEYQYVVDQYVENTRNQVQKEFREQIKNQIIQQFKFNITKQKEIESVVQQKIKEQQIQEILKKQEEQIKLLQQKLEEQENERYINNQNNIYVQQNEQQIEQNQPQVQQIKEIELSNQNKEQSQNSVICQQSQQSDQNNEQQEVHVEQLLQKSSLIQNNTLNNQINIELPTENEFNQLPQVPVSTQQQVKEDLPIIETIVQDSESSQTVNTVRRQNQQLLESTVPFVDGNVNATVTNQQEIEKFIPESSSSSIDKDEDLDKQSSEQEQQQVKKEKTQPKQKKRRTKSKKKKQPKKELFDSSMSQSFIQKMNNKVKQNKKQFDDSIFGSQI